MAGKSDVFENDLLKLIFNNVAILTIGDANGIVGSTSAGSLFVSLHTADPGEAGTQSTSETTYGGYSRVAVARSTAGWTITTNQAKPTSVITFPACTSGSSTITHFAIGAASTGTGKVLYAGSLSPTITVTAGITPQLTTNTVVSED